MTVRPPEPLVDLVHVDGVPVAAAHPGERAIGEPGLGPTVRAWWTATGPAARAMVALAVALLLAAGAVAAVAAGRHPHTTVASTVITDPPAPAGLDAVGCPIGATCALRPARGLLIVIGIDGYENFSVISALETYDVAESRVYRREVVAHSSDSVLRIVAQCVPGPAMADGSRVQVDDHDPALVSAFVRVDSGDGCNSYAYFAGPASAALALRIASSFARDVRVVIQ